MVQTLRRSNAVAISDLARVSTPENSVTSSFSRARGWHDAVNAGALLTEPWTAVLIRAFVKATSVLLAGISDSYSENLDSDLERCNHCAKALWYLGRKSDVALWSAQTVMDAIEQEQKRWQISCTVFSDMNGAF